MLDRPDAKEDRVPVLLIVMLKKQFWQVQFVIGGGGAKKSYMWGKEKLHVGKISYL